MYFTSLRYTSPTFVSSMVNTIASMTFVIALCLRYTCFPSYILPVKFKSLAFCKRKSKKKPHFSWICKNRRPLFWNLNQFSSFDGTTDPLNNHGSEFWMINAQIWNKVTWYYTLLKLCTDHSMFGTDIQNSTSLFYSRWAIWSQ